MNATITEIPRKSLIQSTQVNCSFKDSFEISFISEIDLCMVEVVNTFFSSMKVGWVSRLFKLRNLFTKEQKKHLNKLTSIKVGDKIAFFDVLDVKDNEVLLFREDIHLKTWFSVIINNNDLVKKVIMSTTVEVKKRLGFIYMFIIKPFHKLIVRSVLKKTALLYKTKIFCQTP